MPDQPLPPPARPKGPLSVSELTRGIRQLLETRVGTVEVEGEIGNWMQAASGHAYFSLKDEGALLSCVMFKGSMSRLDFRPGEGMKVVVRGKISVYERRGQYQMVVSTMSEAGLGDLYRRFLELKRKLEEEGLFAEERKRPIPPLPKRIGVVTSATGAVLRDIIHVIRRRFSGLELIISPSMVQGDEAPPQIIRAIERLNTLSARSAKEAIDVMIVGRGGGSIEDLWAFNDEGVARAIAASKIPVISAVGHETDFTIADFVADLRAPTPSAAAEIVVVEAEGLIEGLSQARQRMQRAIMQQVQTARLELNRLAGSWGLRQPQEQVRQAVQRLDDLNTRFETIRSRTITDAQNRVDSLAGRLAALNPTAVLGRGYSIVTRARDQRVLTRATQVRVGDHLSIRLSQGELRATAIPKGEDFLDGVPM